MVGRAGAERLLADHPPPVRSVLGIDNDAELDGWEAHVHFLKHLQSVKLT